jgi:hypothetical protein
MSLKYALDYEDYPRDQNVWDLSNPPDMPTHLPLPDIKIVPKGLDMINRMSFDFHILNNAASTSQSTLTHVIIQLSTSSTS